MISIRLSGCAVFDDQGRLLLIHHDKNGKKQWETPGGKVEIGETDEAAARRELLEELGVKVIIISKIGESDFYENKQQYHYVWFEGKLANKISKSTLETGFDDYEYVSFADLKHSPEHLSEGTKKFLKVYWKDKGEL